MEARPNVQVTCPCEYTGVAQLSFARCVVWFEVDLSCSCFISFGIRFVHQVVADPCLR